ncbi:MAG: malate synthase G, partial [Pseudomonadota bacterium]
MIERAGLQIDPHLLKLVEEEALEGLPIEATQVWEGLAALLSQFADENAALLHKRAELQSKIDDWHRQHPGPIQDIPAYQEFLQDIGYLEAEPDDFKIVTQNVDPEISSVAGPQLVVPISNARYALNAANARWGSLYDALYGTDAISPDVNSPEAQGYDPKRGAAVVAWAKSFLDDAFPLKSGSYTDVTGYSVEGGQLHLNTPSGTSQLKDQGQFIGYKGDEVSPTHIVLKNNGLHIVLKIDPSHPVGQDDPAGVSD